MDFARRAVNPRCASRTVEVQLTSRLRSREERPLGGPATAYYRHTIATGRERCRGDWSHSAGVCGYLSLSERGALVAFWYPAVLWMLLVLDRPGSRTAGAFDSRMTLPFVAGLAALFVVFLRARESRRSALWSSRANAKLATPRGRTVLRTSPARSASQVAWTAVAGAGALVIAAWLAPHLWQKETHSSPNPMAVAGATLPADGAGVAGAADQVCCERAAEEEAKRERGRGRAREVVRRTRERRRPRTRRHLRFQGTRIRTGRRARRRCRGMALRRLRRQGTLLGPWWLLRTAGARGRTSSSLRGRWR